MGLIWGATVLLQRKRKGASIVSLFCVGPCKISKDTAAINDYFHDLFPCQRDSPKNLKTLDIFGLKNDR